MTKLNSFNMEIKQKNVRCHGIKFFVKLNDKEVGRAYLYTMKNDLHREPFGLLEDVFIDENLRGRGMGTKLIKQVIKKAKEIGCYKLIATSRHSRLKVHDLYIRFGFKNHGIEFRMDF